MQKLPCAVLLPLLCWACGSTTQSNTTSSAGASGNAAATAGAGGQVSAAGAASTGAGSSSAGTSSGGTTSAGSGGAPGQMAGTGGASAGQATAGSSGALSGETPPEGVPPSYHLVYGQTFADPTSIGDLVFGNPTQWKHKAGGFLESTGTSYMPPYRSPFTVAIVKSIKVQSFVMDVEMLQTSPDGDAHRDMVLIWSFVNPSQFYYAHISTAHDGVAHNIHIVNNADRKAISTTFTPGYDWGRDVWKRLRVVHDVENGAMSVYDLDTLDAPLLTASDKTFGGGYVGFGSFDNTGRVRNVKVWAGASTPGNPDFFAPAP